MAKVAGPTFFILIVEAANCVVEHSAAEQALAKDTADDGEAERAGSVIALPGNDGTRATVEVSAEIITALFVDHSLAPVPRAVFTLSSDGISESVLAEPSSASAVLRSSFDGAIPVTDANGFEDDAVSKANLAIANGAGLIAGESVVEDRIPVDGTVRAGLANVAGPVVGLVSDCLSRVGEAEDSPEGDDLVEGFGLDRVAGPLAFFGATAAGPKASDMC